MLVVATTGVLGSVVILEVLECLGAIRLITIEDDYKVNWLQMVPTLIYIPCFFSSGLASCNIVVQF